MLSAVLKCSCLEFLHLCDICLNVRYIGAWLRMRRDCSNGMLLACILFNRYGLLLSILLIVAIHHKLCSHQLLLCFFEKVVTTFFGVPSLFYFMHFHSYLTTFLYFCLMLFLALCLFTGIELTFRSFINF